LILYKNVYFKCQVAAAASHKIEHTSHLPNWFKYHFNY